MAEEKKLRKNCSLFSFTVYSGRPRNYHVIHAAAVRTYACGCGPRMGRPERSSPTLAFIRQADDARLLSMTFPAWYQNNPSLPTLRVPASWKPHSHFGALAPACSCGFGRLIAVGLCTQASLVPSAFSYHPALFWAKKYRLFFDNRPKAVFNKKTGILIKTR